MYRFLLYFSDNNPFDGIFSGSDKYKADLLCVIGTDWTWQGRLAEYAGLYLP
jgi:hypothetical protein